MAVAVFPFQGKQGVLSASTLDQVKAFSQPANAKNVSFVMMLNRSFTWRAVGLSAALSFLFFVARVDAGSFSWNTNVNANWNDPASWGTNTIPNASGDSVFFGNVISAPRNVSINSSNITVGSLYFNAANAYTIRKGTGSGSLTLNNNGNGVVIAVDAANLGAHVFAANLPITLADNLTISNASGALLSMLGNINVNTFGITGTAGGNVTLGGIISGSGGLTYNGSGIWTLSGASTYSGATIVNSGTVRAGAANAFSANSAFTVNGPGTLDLNNFSQIIAALSGNGTVTLGSGNLTVGNATSTTFSGNMSGSGTLIKQGAGRLTVTGSLSHGGTTVNAGAFVVNGSHTAAVTVNSGGRLEGTGTITGGLALNAGGALSAGDNGVGTLTLGGSSTFTGGSTLLQLDMNNATGTAGADWDLISVANLTLAATAGSAINISLAGNPGGFDSSTPYTWVFASAGAPITGFDSSGFTVQTTSFTPDTGGGSFAVQMIGNDLALVFTPVPEPSTLALGALGLGALVLAGRRRKA
jgi:autotransporter-associated beta strand protein